MICGIHWNKLVSPKICQPFCNGSVEKFSVMVVARAADRTDRLAMASIKQNFFMD